MGEDFAGNERDSERTFVYYMPELLFRALYSKADFAKAQNLIDSDACILS